MKRVLLAILSITTVVACNSDNEGKLSISGKVLEYGTDNPIENAKLYIIGGQPNGGLGGSTEFFVDTIFTDVDGDFTLNNAEADDAAYYSITRVTKDDYFEHTEDIPIHGNYEEIMLDPFAWLEINTVNDPTITGDFCSVGAYFISGVTMQGEFNNTYKLKGARYVRLSIKKDPLGSAQIDSIFLSPLDTSFFEILF
jgi:hypothetical protein